MIKPCFIWVPIAEFRGSCLNGWSVEKGRAIQTRRNCSVLGKILGLILLDCDWSTERRESVFLVWPLSTLIQQFFDIPLAILIAAQLLCFMVYDLILLSREYRKKIEYWNLVGKKVIYESYYLLLLMYFRKNLCSFQNSVHPCSLTI